MNSRFNKSLANSKAIIVILMLSLILIAIKRVNLAAAEQSHTAQTQPKLQFGGSFSGLDTQRQQLIENLVDRFNRTTGQKVEAADFYDNFISLSTKTTFDAVTNALMTSQLTTASGEKLGNALDLVQQVDAVHGMIRGASGDQQFRMYAVLKENAIDILNRSQEFKHTGDNTVYHKGYPTNYRELGFPSVQISIALDQRHADIDVDYRSASFPVALFNGHLSASNSDVRAGDNYERHTHRWQGFKNWWRSFFGIDLKDSAYKDVKDPRLVFPDKPRVGKKDIDEMMNDFLSAWLVEGNIMAAMSYISPRAYACLAQDYEDPSSFDRGMAPFMMLNRLKAAHDALAIHTSLDGLTTGYRLTTPGLKLVKQPHSEFIIYSVPDDVAAKFDCENSMNLGNPKKVAREYGNYFGATFYVTSENQSHAVALLWGKDDDYWKIISWQKEVEKEKEPVPVPAMPDVQIVTVKSDPTFVNATHDFLENWIISKNYDKAFSYFSPKSYSCYNLFRQQDEPVASSQEEAQKIRAKLEESGEKFGKRENLGQVIESVQPVHSEIRMMEQPYSGEFSLASVPDIFIQAFDCEARARGERYNAEIPPIYGKAFAMAFRLKTEEGDAPVMRTLWVKEDGNWRNVAYDVEVP